MKKIIVSTPAIDYFLARFRDKATGTYDCTACVENISLFLAGELSNYLYVKKTKIKTPLGEKICSVIDEEIILVPVLRAGISMLHAFQQILPMSKTGFIWAHRDENASAMIDKYKFPEINHKPVIILDTMLATAGTINACADLLSQYNPRQIMCASILSTAKGVEQLTDSVSVLVTASVSDSLDKNNYVYPGVGDSGDRLYG